MVTYEYKCTNVDCDFQWEEQQKITEEALRICPKCQQETAMRLISGGTGFQLKGSGWFNKGGY